MARWFGIVERDAVVRSLLASPLPVPGPVVRRAVEEAYRRLAFRRPGSVDPRVIATFAGHLGSKAAAGRILRSGRRLLPELRHPFRLDRIGCPVLLVWGEDDVMVARTGSGPRAGGGGRGPARGHRGLRALPADRAPGRGGRAGDGLPGDGEASGLRLSRGRRAGGAPCAHRDRRRARGPTRDRRSPVSRSRRRARTGWRPRPRHRRRG